MNTLSPLDSRYSEDTKWIKSFFTDESLTYLKLQIELDYFISLLNKFNIKYDNDVICDLKIEESDVLLAKKIEKETNHDIKAIEYALKEKLSKAVDEKYLFLLHFGLTSQDINSLATSITMESFIPSYINEIKSLKNLIEKIANEKFDLPMMARTHGQPAVVTSFKKELLVYSYRLDNQLKILSDNKIYAKFGGAVGNLSAHYFAYPDEDWDSFMDTFVGMYKIQRHKLTTQVDGNDWLALMFSICANINNILIDFSRDMWMYNSYGYLKMETLKNEIGSSTMPQKINPINFENAEGNLEFANSIFEFMSRKLQISRMQRDLTDTTVMRNVGIPFGHSLVAFSSLKKGLSKVSANLIAIEKDIRDNPSIIAEAIQICLKAEGQHDAYEMVKEVFRSQDFRESHLKDFLEKICSENSRLSNSAKLKLYGLFINPSSYTNI